MTAEDIAIDELVRLDKGGPGGKNKAKIVWNCHFGHGSAGPVAYYCFTRGDHGKKN